jgi:hypothetical protein
MGTEVTWWGIFLILGLFRGDFVLLDCLPGCKEIVRHGIVLFPVWQKWGNNLQNAGRNFGGLRSHVPKCEGRGAPTLLLMPAKGNCRSFDSAPLRSASFRMTQWHLCMGSLRVTVWWGALLLVSWRAGVVVRRLWRLWPRRSRRILRGARPIGRWAGRLVARESGAVRLR